MRSEQKLREIHDHFLALGDDDQSPEPLSWDSIQKKFPLTCPLTNLPKSWTPLIDIEQIKDEGTSMDHCIYRCYLDEMAQGEMLAFSVTTASKMKATISMRKYENDHWQVDQMSGFKNSELLESDRQQILIEEKQITPI